MIDGEAFGVEIVGIVRGFVERATAPLLERIAQLEVRPVGLSVEQETSIVTRVRGALPEARDGQDADPELIRMMVTAAVDALPKAKDGDPGRDADPGVIRGMVDEAVAALPRPLDGKDADPEILRTMVNEAVAALPKPSDGKDADPAVVRQMVNDAVAALPAPRDGKDADPAVIRQMVETAVDALPKPRDGKDIEPEAVRRLVDAAVGALPAPEPGKDGVGLAGALIDRTGALVVTLTDGSTRELGPVVGKDADEAGIAKQIAAHVDAIPRPKDALGFDDLSVIHDGERGFALRFEAGGRAKEFAFSLPVVLDRGVFKAEQQYAAGDAVTWGGSLWIAQRATESKPGEGDDWRLAVKKGRDGRDAKAV